MNNSISEIFFQITNGLKEYIEATYHISNQKLIQQRKDILNIKGNIFQEPFLESTPLYKLGESFQKISGLDSAAKEVIKILSEPSHSNEKIINDPPYVHQHKSLKKSIVEGKNILLMTGTGSGKTESFLIPILSKLAIEAKYKNEIFKNNLAARSIILYPMNALVNDQLGRMRNFYGDQRLVDHFINTAGRPIRFARYTSRTLYPGIRTSKKDGRKLASINHFFVNELNNLNDPNEKEDAEIFIQQLKEKGKWPAKYDIKDWFGRKGEDWIDRRTGIPRRAIPNEKDSELLTRWEVQNYCPDILITNYSMLEYMMLRPIERPIFESIQAWLNLDPTNKILFIIDEAHLYKGAQGTEVAYLLRRFAARLNITSDRIQFILTSASFDENDKKNDPIKFASELTGTDPKSFEIIKGELNLQENEANGSEDDLRVLSDINLSKFYNSDKPKEKILEISNLLNHLKITNDGSNIEEILFKSLKDYPPLKKLINITMKQARSISELTSIFPNSNNNELKIKAITTLASLASIARPNSNSRGLLPCRVHAFYRGLPGLWICLNNNCSEISEDSEGKVGGKLYSQPTQTCGCGSLVFELYTCRNCGTAYARGYADSIDILEDFGHGILWQEAGNSINVGISNRKIEKNYPVDILIEEPSEPPENKESIVNVTKLNFITGEVNPQSSENTINVWLKKLNDNNSYDEDDTTPLHDERGIFKPCAVCWDTIGINQSSVQDHLVKGDQPFHVLIQNQLKLQQPSSNIKQDEYFSPNKGRKVLLFSDSRQMAARLAPNVQTYNNRDVVRSLLTYGFYLFNQNEILKEEVNLKYIESAVLYAVYKLNINLNLEGIRNLILTFNKSIQNKELHTFISRRILRQNIMNTEAFTMVYDVICDKYTGLEALALGMIVPTKEAFEEIIEELPNIDGLVKTKEQKRELLTVWINYWIKGGRKYGFYIPGLTPPDLVSTGQYSKNKINISSGNFSNLENKILNSNHKNPFKRNWIPKLREYFAVPSTLDGNKYNLDGNKLTIDFDQSWTLCNTCKAVQPKYTIFNKCVYCNSENVRNIDPDNDEVFLSRRGYYRNIPAGILNKSNKENILLTITAAEHTAQLNAPQSEDIFSTAEKFELLFQDIKLRPDPNIDIPNSSIDILSSTTTMEVGIDIGKLSGVALRNMPPNRSNYQQRSGRAGRRGNAIATVIGFASSDSHDEHYFSKPKEMISGSVINPFLNLDNQPIAQRHILAYLLQMYHLEKINIDPNEDQGQLFTVLGTVEDFMGSHSPMNRLDFENWIKANKEKIKSKLNEIIIPKVLQNKNYKQNNHLINDFDKLSLKLIDDALSDYNNNRNNQVSTKGTIEDDNTSEFQTTNDDNPFLSNYNDKNLLDRLFYKGVLPKYAFPTDVATFHVFKEGDNSPFNPIFKYAPSQGLAVALSQYSPGKDIWIANSQYKSKVIYTRDGSRGLNRAVREERLYLECSNCSYAITVEKNNEQNYIYNGSKIEKGSTIYCDACNRDTLGPAKLWLRPPGFAHIYNDRPAKANTPIEEISYATPAKLKLPTSEINPNDWKQINNKISSVKERNYLLVTNKGPRDEGYNFCTECGRIDQFRGSRNPISGGAHQKPFPTKSGEETCVGTFIQRRITLGCDFITDILLFSLKFGDNVRLRPGNTSSRIALKTIGEAIIRSASEALDIDPKEFFANHRPSMSTNGPSGKEAEIYIYDTLSGGAGFSHEIQKHQKEILENALIILGGCENKECISSCYRCLRSYKNKLDHKNLDRSIGFSLLNHILNNKKVEINKSRYDYCLNLLEYSLKRLLKNQYRINTIHKISFNGKEVICPIYIETVNGENQTIITVESCLLEEDHCSDASIDEIRKGMNDYNVIPINELIILNNIQIAVNEIYESIVS